MNVLIAGVGYVGQALGESLTAKGHEVVGLTHSAESQQRLQSSVAFPVIQADLTHLASLAKVLTSLRRDFDQVVHCASSGRGGPEKYESVYLNGCRNLIACLPQARLLFTSSTSVYAQTDGSWVDESSAAEPTRETSKILRQTESLVLDHHGIVARLAGIYGPGRSYILRKLFEGTATIEGDGGRYVNQVHRHDIVESLSLLLETDSPKGVCVNVSDSNPQTQRVLYQWLANHFKLELPPSAPRDLNRKRGWTHKRVSNARLRSLGWAPRYASFQEAVLNDASLVPSIATS